MVWTMLNRVLLIPAEMCRFCVNAIITLQLYCIADKGMYMKIEGDVVIFYGINMPSTSELIRLCTDAERRSMIVYKCKMEKGNASSVQPSM
jgi:hypothetical protein